MIDLDKIERVATAARECAPPPWVVDKMMTGDLQPGEQFEDDYEGYTIIAYECEIICDPALDHDVAHYIAECSPDVVLELVARIRELESQLAERRAAYQREADLRAINDGDDEP